MGIPITLLPVSPQPHTHPAFEGYRYSREHGKGNDHDHRVQEASLVEGLDIGEIGVLTDLAGEADPLGLAPLGLLLCPSGT